jgi:hypothetical protein
MIVEITNDEIDRALKKRPCNGDINIPTQIMADPGKYGLSSWGTPPTPDTWTKSQRRKLIMVNRPTPSRLTAFIFVLFLQPAHNNVMPSLKKCYTSVLLRVQG